MKWWAIGGTRPAKGCGLVSEVVRYLDKNAYGGEEIRVVLDGEVVHRFVVIAKNV